MIPVAALSALVDEYIQQFRRGRERELRYFRLLRTDEGAVSQAALAKLPSGKRHPHQYRIPSASLEASRRQLLGNIAAIRGATSFSALFDFIEQILLPIDRIGELVVFDTALRIGARFGLEPEEVYLHRGTRDGARKLGVDGRRSTTDDFTRGAAAANS
jgi:hypothetical protein